MPDDLVITTNSIVSAKTKRGLVVLEWGENKAQFDPEDARLFAHRILRECDNAESDAFLFEFLTKKEIDQQMTVAVVRDFRIHRARLELAAGLRRPGRDEIPPEEIV